MTIVGLAGIAISLGALSIAFPRGAERRYVIFFALFAAHIASTLFYYQYVQSAPADTSLYYFESELVASYDFAFGTVVVAIIVDTLRNLVGGSYLDYFLLFQSFGLWGIVLMLRTFQDIHLEVGEPPSALTFALLFLPGMHFWTSAIGKDAPLFLSVALAVWSAMRLGRRWHMFALAVVIMILFRPHIALVAIAALAVAHVFDPKANPLLKMALLGIAAVAAVWVAGTLNDAIRVNVSGAGTYTEIVERRDGMARLAAGTTTIADAPYPWRLFSLWFRPLFIDAPGLLGIIASFENLLFLFIFGFLASHWRETAAVIRKVFFLRFATIFAVLLSLLLALVFYNVGLALRQKMMILPAILPLFVAQWALHRSRVGKRGDAAAAALRSPGKAPERTDFA